MYVILAALLVIQSYRLAKRGLEVQVLQDSSLEEPLAQVRTENAILRSAIKDIHQKAQETELFIQLSLQLGAMLPDAESDDTIPVSEA